MFLKLLKHKKILFLITAQTSSQKHLKNVKVQWVKMNICETAHICDYATKHYFPCLPASIIA